MTERRGVCFTDLGERRLKNLDRPVRVWLVERIDLGDLAPQLPGAADTRYCRAADGVSLATCAVGEGPPLMLAGSWFTHLQKDWQSPWAHYLRALVQSFRVIRYDQRGTGMSDWDVPEITFEQLVDDLETVVAASGHERVALYGANQAASVALAFAHRCPDRVSRLGLRSGYARGRRRRGNAEEVAESEALVTLIRKGWGSSNPAFRQLMASIFMPDAGPDEIAWFSAFQRETAPAANAARVRELFDNVDVSPLLPEIRVPVLVLHPSGDPAAPVSEGKLMAASIPGARFVLFECDNHMLFENDPEFPRILATLRAFLA